MELNKKITTAGLILIILFCGTLTGCYDRKEIDDMAYVTAIGLDKGKTNFVKMTLQIAVPKAIGGGGDEGGGGGDGSTTITTVETPTLYSGLNMINNYISKRINMSHAKVVVFSEEMAREGIHEYIHAMIRGREFRGSMYVVVARGSAEEYIRSVTPILEVNPTKYYEMNFQAYKYTGFTANAQLINFYLQEECSCSQAVAVLAGVSRYKSSEEIDAFGSTFKQKGRPYPLEGDFKAGDLPKIGEMQSEIMGLAVFDGTKMVGELDGDETKYYLMLRGDFNNSYVTIPDPLKKDKFLILNIRQSRKPVKRVQMEGENPKIYAKAILEADILSIQSGRNYDSAQNMEFIEKSVEDFLKKGMTSFLERTSKEFKSDICGFGKSIKGTFLTWKEWEDFNWLRKYENSTFDVEVDLKIRRPGLIIRTMPAYGTEGKVMD